MKIQICALCGIVEMILFVADQLIMFSVLPIQSGFFFFLSEEECTACTVYSALRGLQMYHTPMLRGGGINVYTLKEDYFSLSFCG